MFSTRKEKRPDAQIAVTYCTYTSPSLPAAGLSPTLHTFSSIHLCEIHLSDLLLRHRTLQTVFVFLEHSGTPKEKLQASLLIQVPDEQVFCTTMMSRGLSLCHFQHAEASFFFQDRRVYDPARTDEDAVWEECKSAKFKTVCCSVPKSHFTF